MNEIHQLLARTYPGSSGGRLLLSPGDVDGSARARLPGAWIPLLDVRSRREARAALGQLWAPVAGDLYWLVHRHVLADHLHGFAILLPDGAPPALLYLFTAEGELNEYRGNLPLDPVRLPERWRPVWAALPPAFQAFYGIHDGWFVPFRPGAETGHLGPLPVEKWWRVGDEIPGLSVENDEEITLADVVITFEDSGGDRQGFEIAEPEPGVFSVYDVRWNKGAAPTGVEFMWAMDERLVEVFFSGTMDESILPE